MNVSDMILDINNHGFEDTEDDQKMILINDTLWDIDAREPWPYLVKSIPLNFDGVSASSTTSLADMKAVLWISDLITGEAVWPERLETIRDRYASTLTSVDVPASFYFVGQNLRFYPTPNSSTARYLLDYQAVQPALTSSSLEASILLPQRHHRAIVLGALSKLYALEDSPDEAQLKLAEFETRIQNMREDLFRQQWMRPDRIFVTDESDSDYWTW